MVVAMPVTMPPLKPPLAPISIPVAVPFLGSVPNRNELVAFVPSEYSCLTAF